MPGLQKLIIQSPCELSLPPDDLAWLRDRAETPTLLADIARWQGLTHLTLTTIGLRAEVQEPQSGGTSIHMPMVRPLAVDRADVRRQMVVAVWFHLLTGQVDWNAGNVAFADVPDQPGAPLRLVLFDNDLAFGRCLMHPEDACNNERGHPPPRRRHRRHHRSGSRCPPVHRSQARPRHRR